MSRGKVWEGGRGRKQFRKGDLAKSLIPRLKRCGIAWVRESFAWAEDEAAYKYLLFGDPDILKGVLEGLLEMRDLFRGFYGQGSCRRF